MTTAQIFGELTFNDKVMREKLSKELYTEFMDTIHIGKSLDKRLADNIAHAMKEWAIEKGATHFTHWFQPLRGGTAEKHDSFLSYDERGNVIERFSGSQLIQSEPDASSFPSGGMRSTFEARGYTAWDPTSPAYLLRAEKTFTLVIPSVFLSWTGMVLDHKTPLLRSHLALEDSAIKLRRLLGNRNAKSLNVFAGPEQEYFLIPKALYEKRPDLKICGRTLFGAAPAKGQQMEDHYFGAIKPKVLRFMEDLDHELYCLGIPSKTRHNEVAPNQFEIAPLYEEANRAIDHNLLLIDIMKKTAEKHDLVCLVHEKPFDGVNGSGKHLNWSIGDNTCGNYLEPSASPLKNITFLNTIGAVLLGVQEYGGLLRLSVADAGNDHRLGANEAPPGIMSVYLGDYLSKMLDNIEDIKSMTEKKLSEISLGLRRLPKIVRDSSDRNRTSPIAFTGNKFEFRAVGSAQNCSEAATMINLMVAYGYDYIHDRLQKMSGNIKENALIVLKDILQKTKAIRFEGNNYDNQWHSTAEERGLPNFKDTPSCLHLLTQEKTVKLFERYNVLSETELHSKQEIRFETYIKTKVIEYKVAGDMSRTMITPAIIKQITLLSNAVVSAQNAGVPVSEISQDLELFKGFYINIKQKTDNLENVLNRIMAEVDVKTASRLCVSDGDKALAELREIVDAVEVRIHADLWPITKYQDLLL
ncbi:MAG: glutamine synthetase III [Spirochaetales bacterium]|nr:glutamine synthetase III [Spirochaetales bacterium]